jgi:dihydrofolate reductase
VTHRHDWAADGAERAASVDDALVLAAADGPDRVWVIGGAQLFHQVLSRADRLEVTELRAPGGGGVVAAEPGDALAPQIDRARWRIAHAEPADGWLASRAGVEYRFLRYARA